MVIVYILVGLLICNIIVMICALANIKNHPLEKDDEDEEQIEYIENWNKKKRK